MKNILFKISGHDKPGITANLTTLIAKHHLIIKDIGQSVTHGLLSLSILTQFSKETIESELLKDFLYEANNSQFQLDYEFVESKDVKRVFAEEFVISCINPKGLSSLFIKEIAEFCASKFLNLLDIKNKSLNTNLTSLDLHFVCNDPLDIKNLKSHILKISRKHQVDLSIVQNNVFRYNKRLIIFDMDSTLIQTEVIEELAKLAGSHEEVKKITDQAMEGEIDFSESLKKRVKTLKGLEKEKLTQLCDKIPLTDGVEEVIKTVKSLGFKVGIISGGFTFFTDYFKNKLNLDYAFSNKLEFDSKNTLTGNVEGQIVDAEKKAILLELIAQQESISLDQVVAIGDGANDLQMLAMAGMGIAFHARKIVRDAADHQMSHGPMTSILHFLGIPESYFKN